MEVHFPPELQTKLNRLAVEQGRQPESLVHEAVERMLDYDQWFVAQVELGMAQAERGELLDHDEVEKRMERLLSRKQTGS